VAYLELIKIDLQQAVDRAPIFGSQLTKFYKLAEGIAAETEGNFAENFGSIDNFTNQGADTLGNIIGDLNDPDLKTLNSSNVQVNIAEKAITILKFDLGMISNMGGMLEWMIRPIFADLQNVRDEMAAFLSRADAYSTLSGQGQDGLWSQLGDSGQRLK